MYIIMHTTVSKTVFFRILLFINRVHKCIKCGATLGVGDECGDMYSEECC